MPEPHSHAHGNHDAITNTNVYCNRDAITNANSYFHIYIDAQLRRSSCRVSQLVAGR